MLTISSLETDNFVLMMYHIHNDLRKAPYMLWLNVVSTNAYWSGNHTHLSSCHNGNYIRIIKLE